MYDELVVVFGKVVAGLPELLAQLLITGIFLVGISRFILAELTESPIEMD